MGIDLKLLIVDGHMSDHGYSHSLLEWGRNYPTHELIKSIAFDLPIYSLNSYFHYEPLIASRTYGKVNEDCYGDKIKYCKAGDFIKTLKDIQLDNWQRACIAFISIIPEDTLIGLYWH